MSVKGDFLLDKDIEITRMNNPPAYLVEDEEDVEFINEGREYKLNYAGKLVKENV